jgi:uncharacterized protein YfdQ (DUF2303 family)
MEKTEDYIYKGKIIDVQYSPYKGVDSRDAELNFFVTEGENKGLSIFINYYFENEDAKNSFAKDLEGKLEKEYQC